MRVVLASTACFLVFAVPAIAQIVKVTPVGSHPGELCANGPTALPIG